MTENQMVEFDFNANLNTIPVIESNIADLKAFVDEVKSMYVAHPVDESNIVAAKKDLANFRKVESAIDAKVKGVRRQLLAPYEEYKARVDEVTSELKDIEAELKSGIDAELQRQVERKKAQVDELIASINSELPPSVASVLDTYWPVVWTNKTYTLKKVEEDYRRTASEAEATLCAISGNPHEAQLLGVFKNYYSYAKVSQRMKELAEEDRRLAELKAHQEEERKREEEAAARAMTVPTFTAPTAPATPEPEPVKEEPERPMVLKAAFVIVGMENEIAYLVEHARNIGIGIKRTSHVFIATEEDIENTNYKKEN